MLFIARDDKDGTILARWDGWYINAEAEAQEFIRVNGLKVKKVEITLMGNKVIWVE